MAKLNLPLGAEAGYRLEYRDAFGCTFTIHVYGRDRDGWFLASRRDTTSSDSGRQNLTPGTWRMLGDFIGRSGFWGFPETVPERTDCVVEDGDWITLTGRDGERYHEVRRFVWREPELDRLYSWLRRISGLFPAA